MHKHTYWHNVKKIPRKLKVLLHTFAEMLWRLQTFLQLTGMLLCVLPYYCINILFLL